MVLDVHASVFISQLVHVDEKQCLIRQNQRPSQLVKLLHDHAIYGHQFTNIWMIVAYGHLFDKIDIQSLVFLHFVFVEAFVEEFEQLLLFAILIHRILLRMLLQVEVLLVKTFEKFFFNGLIFDELESIVVLFRLMVSFLHKSLDTESAIPIAAHLVKFGAITLPQPSVQIKGVRQRIILLLEVDILDQNLHILVESILVRELSQLADLHVGVGVDFLLDIFLGLFGAIIHFVDSLAESLSPLEECVVYQGLVQLRSKNHIDLFVVEESYLPLLMAEILREVFEISGFEPFDVVQGDQLTLLFI